MTDFTLNAQARSDLGKGASRRLRRNASLVPAVIYGGDEAPQSIAILAKELAKLLETEASFSHVISLNVDGTAEPVLIKALQRHPAKSFVLHADFMRVVEGHKLTATVPLHFINQESSVGVKQQGGEVLHNINEVEVSCLPQDLPEFIEVDLAKVEIGQVVHMTDIKLPKGVELVSLAHGSDLPVANIHAPRVSKEDAPKEEGADE
ncbi:50S ribosomal protein L25/general stress protein Ctc [Stutzerimonas azotifigens]|uniref:Large ribosomal subunit protein bL25 n=1 Tax=Stutzerimonas azotifigens TaxID=291995 RepID=A0ABR5Z720_9GAMM|nr:50S ribosomal protein L25/general stress protein Ctc [Stutzerimonas azotifigens]MBA1276006.1 50S ribosomal protein L25/general stress protein Ctc [Stutzerimonas azotifigens]